jgi:D-alanyl-D-alanine carboxypeptidase
MQDAAGDPQVGLSASLQQSSNITAPPPPEAAGRPGVSPFGSDLGSGEVQAAIARVRSAPIDQRYGRLIDLMHALRGTEAL